VVVVLDVLPDNVMQMSGTHNERVVEAFPSQATDETFADGVGLRLSWPKNVIRAEISQYLFRVIPLVGRRPPVSPC
jgi:hypothetical protein